MNFEKIYRFCGINDAVEVLRPGASYEISNSSWSRWDDERPCPSMDEVKAVQAKLKELEDFANTIYTKDQLKFFMQARNQTVADDELTKMFESQLENK
jgi:hypothetical protein